MNRYEKFAAALIDHLPARTLEQILANIDAEPMVPATLTPTCCRLGAAIRDRLSWSGSPEKLAKIQKLAQYARHYSAGMFNLALAAKRCDQELAKLAAWITEHGQHWAKGSNPDDFADQDVKEFIRSYKAD